MQHHSLGRGISVPYVCTRRPPPSKKFVEWLLTVPNPESLLTQCLAAVSFVPVYVFCVLIVLIEHLVVQLLLLKVGSKSFPETV